jgi:hypothetical protein
VAEREKVVPAKCLKQAFSATPSTLEYSLTGWLRAVIALQQLVTL